MFIILTGPVLLVGPNDGHKKAARWASASQHVADWSSGPTQMQALFEFARHIIPDYGNRKELFAAAALVNELFTTFMEGAVDGKPQPFP